TRRQVAAGSAAVPDQPAEQAQVLAQALGGAEPAHVAVVEAAIDERLRQERVAEAEPAGAGEPVELGAVAQRGVERADALQGLAAYEEARHGVAGDGGADGQEVAREVLDVADAEVEAGLGREAGELEG